MTSERSVIPLFPLQIVLFPGELLPLHIFEPRYREMIGRCLNSGEPFGVFAETEEGLATIGCTARIRRVIRRYDDGRLDIETEGERRLKLVETFEDQSYLTGSIELLEDVGTSGDPELREQAVALHMKLVEALGGEIQPSAYSDNERVSFKIAPTAGLDLSARLDLLRLDDESDRLDKLVKHLRSLIPQVEEARERRRKISSNGHV